MNDQNPFHAEGKRKEENKMFFHVYFHSYHSAYSFMPIAYITQHNIFFLLSRVLNQFEFDRLRDETYFSVHV